MAFLGFPYRHFHTLEMAQLRQRDNCVLIEKHLKALNENASLTQHCRNKNAVSAYLSPPPLDLIAQHDCLS